PASLRHHPSPSFPTRRSSDLRGDAGLAIVVFHLPGALPDDGNRNAGPAELPQFHAAKVIGVADGRSSRARARPRTPAAWPPLVRDRKSTRLNSSHVAISYAVF